MILIFCFILFNQMKTFKIVLVGDDNVGKSTFVQRLYDNSFKESYSPTLGKTSVFQVVVI